MSCHIVGPMMRALCGRDKFGEDPEDGTFHSYVESLGRRLEMATCKDCRREYHRRELERIEEED